MKILFSVSFLLIFLSGCQPLIRITPDETLIGVGSASISAQTGITLEEKQFKAMRASKLEAYRELAEQVYGLRITGKLEVDEQSLNQDSTKGDVDGVIRAAEVITSYPVGDTYVTELKLDLDKMRLMEDFGEIQQVPKNSVIIF